MGYLQVKLCDPYLSAFETLCGKMRYTNRRILYMKHLQSSTRHTKDTTLSSFNLTGVFGQGQLGLVSAAIRAAVATNHPGVLRIYLFVY